jgi:hypothetical protein
VTHVIAGDSRIFVLKNSRSHKVRLKLRAAAGQVIVWVLSRLGLFLTVMALSSPCISEEVKDDNTLPVQKKARWGPKLKALNSEATFLLSLTPNEVPSSDTGTKSELANEIEMQMKSEWSMSLLEDEMRKKVQKFRNS